MIKKIMTKGNNIFTHHKLFLIGMTLFFLLFFIFYFMPPVADDFYFIDDPSNLPGLIDVTMNRYIHLNGRILGNMSIVYFLDHPIIYAFYRTTILFIMIYCVYHIIIDVSKKKSIILFLVTFGFIFFVPLTMFRELYSWGSAFCNYVPPIALFMLILYQVKDIFTDIERVEKDYKKNSLLFLLSIVTQLFMENFTLYFVFISFMANGYYYIKTKRVSKTLLAIMLGSVIGAGIMFCAPIYQNLEARGGYHGDKINSIVDFINRLKENYYTMSFYTWHIHSFVMFLTSVLAIYILYKEKKATCFSLIDKLAIIFFIITPIYCYLINTYFGSLYQLRFLVIFIDAIFIFGYYFALFYLGIYYIKNKIVRKQLIFFICSIFIVNAPLLIVLPLTLRCFYFSYVFTIMIILILCLYLVHQYKLNIEFLTPITIIVILTLMLSYVYMMYENDKTEQERIQMLETALHEKKKSVSIPVYRFPDLIYGFGRDGRISLNYYYKEPGDFIINYR